MKALYLGIFFDASSSDLLRQQQGQSLAKLVRDLHCTFKFKPTAEDLSRFLPLVDKPVMLSVVGYGADAQNSGFSVAIPSDLASLYDGNNQPHITVSLAENGKAVNTGSLVFSPIDSFFVYGRIGICYDTGIVC